MSSRSSVRNADNPPRLVAELRRRETGIKDAVLGKKYELSLVFCKNSLSRKLNRIYRGKDKPTNVLSFPISKVSGEIFINTDKLDGFTPIYLLIHGLLHLKGMQHGAKMESEEKKLLKKFNGTTHLSRNRHRKLKHQGSSSRRS